MGKRCRAGATEGGAGGQAPGPRRGRPPCHSKRCRAGATEGGAGGQTQGPCRGLPATASNAELAQQQEELATENIKAAIEARQIGNANLSQHHFLRALSHGASKSDPRLHDLLEWLFHENVRSKVSAATISGDLFEVEAEISLAQKCKYPDDQHLNSLIDLRKPLLKKLISDLACAPDGGALDQPSATIFCDRIEQLGVELTRDLSLLTEGDFVGIPPIKVRRVLPLLLKMGERATSKSEAAYSQFMATCPVTAEVAKPVWAEDSYTGTFDNGQPLRGPSPVDMWSDPNPPAAVARLEWEKVRDSLHNTGKSLGGPKGSIGNLVYRASLALNLMHHQYTGKSDLFVLGGQGRLLVERTLGVFLHGQDLGGREFSIEKKIKMMEGQNLACKEMVAACHKVRWYGNRTDPDETDDLTPEDKPDVIKNAFIVAQALLLKVRKV